MRARLIVALALLACATRASAAPVRLTIGTAAGTPGSVVRIDVAIDPADQTVLGAQSDIEFGPLTPVQTLPGGALDCAANPALAPLLSPTFTCITTPPAACDRLRAIVFRPFGSMPLAAATLYTCRFAIDPTAVVGGTFPLHIRAAQASDALGRGLTTEGVSGSIHVVAPTPTPTASETAAPSPTPTASPSQTATPTTTRTATTTGTLTPTPLTPIPTATTTPTPAIALRVSADMVPPGGVASLVIDLVDRTGAVTGCGFDLLLPEAVFDATVVAGHCGLDSRILSHGLSGNTVGDPPAPAGYRRIRMVILEQSDPPTLLGTGQLVTCLAPAQPDAPPGVYALELDRLFAGDASGTLLLGVGAAGGTVVIDPEAPPATATSTLTCTPTASRTPTLSPTRTRTSLPTAPPTPTASRMPLPTATALPTAAIACPGDCNGDRMVNINELILAVVIAGNGAPLESCRPADADGNGAVAVNELVAAVNRALAGC